MTKKIDTRVATTVRSTKTRASKAPSKGVPPLTLGAMIEVYNSKLEAAHVALGLPYRSGPRRGQQLAHLRARVAEVGATGSVGG